MIIVNDETSEKNKHSLINEMLEMSSKAKEVVSKGSEDQAEPEEPILRVDEKKRVDKKKYEFKMTEDEKEMNRKILKNMNRKLNFVRNPRFRNNNKCLLYSNTMFKEIINPENPFVVEPMVVTFREYQMNSVYQIDLKLLNRKQLLTSFKYIPPLTENFSIKRIIYPKKDSSLIAPGMCAKLEILFNATSLDSFSDELTIITETFAFKVPLRAIRDSPALSLENPMDCKKCLIGDQTSMMFRCKNNGGDAHFKFLLPENLGLDQSQNSGTQYSGPQNESEVLELGPFSIFPQEFYLYKGMMIEIFVNFSPKVEGLLSKNFTICCDSKAYLDYAIEGEGIMIDMQLTYLDGLKIDNDSEHFEKLENLYFEDTFPFTTSRRTLKIINKSSVQVRYHWAFYDFYAQNKFSTDDENDYFRIEPEEGIFQPYEELAFTLHFNPKNSKIYEQKLDMIIEDIPFQAIKNYSPTSTLSTIRQRNHFTKGEPFMLAANSPYPSYPILSFNLKGKGKLPYLEVDNNFINIGDVYIGQQVFRSFNISNPKTGIINFKLTKSLQAMHHQSPVKINNFFQTPHHFPVDSLFKAKKHEIVFSKIPNLYNTKNTINEMLECNSNILQAREKETYERVNFMKILASSLVLKRNMLNTSTMAVNKSTISKKGSSRLSLGKLQSKLSFRKSNPPALKNNHNISVTEIEIEENLPMVIEKDQSYKFNVSFIPTSLGIFKSSLVFTPEDGVPFSIDFVANVKGPKIRLDTPCLDFGLFQISQIQTLKFKIINTSPIPAQFLIKQSKYKNINFSNYIDYGYVEDVEGVITEPKYRKQIASLNDYENRDMVKRDFRKLDLYDLKFSQVVGMVAPSEAREIVVTFLSPYPKRIEDTIEIMVENSNSSYVNLFADCQEAHAYLNLTTIQPKDIFVSVPITLNDNKFEMVNPSNLPIHFKWEEVHKSEEMKVTFRPNEGVIQPRSSQVIKFSAVYHEMREVDDLFKCFIDEMEVPLGVIIKGKVIGLDILYEITDDTITQMILSGKQASENLSVRSGKSTRSRGRKSTSFGRNEEKVDKTLKLIDLKNVKVNKPYYFSFVVKNLSGITTSFRIYSKNYGPSVEKDVSKNDYSLMNSFLNTDKTHKSSSKNSVTNTFRKSLHTKGKKETLDHQILSDAHEDINFSSPKGYEFTKLKQIEKDAEFYLTNKKGVAIVVEPRSGRLEPHSEVIVKISIFNECVGDFFDELICEVKGLPPRVFPINLRIRGNPLQLSPFQPGINYNVEPPVLKLGSVITRVNKIEKVFKLLNTGSNMLSVEWKVYDYQDVLYPKRVIFDIKVQENKNKSFSLVYNPVEPMEFPEDKKYFEIFPKTCLINPKALRDFIITFNTDNPGLNSALVVGYPKFEDGHNSKVKLSELALKVDAFGVTPNLVVDKNKTFDDKFKYKFYYHSAGRSPAPKKSIVLINKEKINFIVRTIVEGPFRIIKTDPMEATIGVDEYNIIPNSNLKLDVKFIAPNVEDENEWPMTLVNEKHGLLKIQFENGDISEYLLTAILRRPRLTLSVTGNEAVEGPNFVYFGYVNCESQRKHSLFLTNETEVETKWSINYIKFTPKKTYGHGTITKEEKEDLEKTDDPDVFHFSITQGLIPGPSHQLTSIPLGPALPQVYNEKSNKLLPVKIEVLFKPKKNVFYKSRYRIIAETGNQIDFILKGHGSYMEEHI